MNDKPIVDSRDAEIEALRAERDSYHADYREKCDYETKVLVARNELLCTEMALLRARIADMEKTEEQSKAAIARYNSAITRSIEAIDARNKMAEVLSAQGFEWCAANGWNIKKW